MRTMVVLIKGVAAATRAVVSTGQIAIAHWLESGQLGNHCFRILLGNSVMKSSKNCPDAYSPARENSRVESQSAECRASAPFLLIVRAASHGEVCSSWCWCTPSPYSSASCSDLPNPDAVPDLVALRDGLHLAPFWISKLAKLNYLVSRSEENRLWG